MTFTVQFLRLHVCCPQNDSTTEHRRRQHLLKEEQVGFFCLFVPLFFNSEPLDSATIEPWKIKKIHSKGKPHFTLSGIIFNVFPTLAQAS